MLELLQEYEFVMKHRAGWKHGNADALARVPCWQCGREDEESMNELDSMAVGTVELGRKHQSNFEQLSLLIR